MSANLSAQLALLPDYLGSHLLLSVIALAIGIIISLPLGLIATRVKWLQVTALSAAGILQTIPGLALLALMVPLLGMIGFVPAATALILYGMLPILRNTVTGIQNIDPSLTEAARGMGMTDPQVLFRVELPLAAPVVIAGIRTATVWVVGMTTLSTPVGATSLGNYIFSGLQTQNHTAVLVGCAAAALLAIVLDALIRMLEAASSKRNKPLALIASGLLIMIIFAGLWPRFSHSSDSDQRTVIVGAKTFTEQYILSRVIQQRLTEHGFNAEAKESLGSVVLFEALAQGLIDCYVDYSGTIWVNSMKQTNILGRQAVMDSMTNYLAREHGIRCLGSLGFENRYALAMRRAQSEELQIETIDDLSRIAEPLTYGGDYEFFGRPEWTALEETYHLNVPTSRRRSMDATLMYSAVAEEQVDVISAFSTDGRIVEYNLSVLDDPRQALPPYDAVLLLSPQASRDARLVNALSDLIGTISDDEMRTANKIVDVDKQPLDSAVAYLQSVMQ